MSTLSDDCYVLGFSNEYYTLWYSQYIETKFGGYLKNSYLCNLSKDYDEAIEKISKRSKHYKIDLSLKGQSFNDYSNNNKVKFDDFTIKNSNFFCFGKYTEQLFTEIDNENYLIWYYKATENGQLKKLLVSKGYTIFEKMIEVQYNEFFVTEKQIIVTKKENELIFGHHYTDKQKIEIEVKEINRKAYESDYGYMQYTYYVSYIDRNNRFYQYVGSKPINGLKDDFRRVKATIKLVDKNDKKTTRLQRMKIVD